MPNCVQVIEPSFWFTLFRCAETVPIRNKHEMINVSFFILLFVNEVVF